MSRVSTVAVRVTRFLSRFSSSLSAAAAKASLELIPEVAGRFLPPPLFCPEIIRVATACDIRKLLPCSNAVCTLRHRSLESRQLRVRYSDALRLKPGAKPPSASWLEMTYPFSLNSFLREEYKRFDTNRLRLGLLLEDMDAFAGDIAVRHVAQPGLVPVTASVDRIEVLRTAGGGVPLDCDIQLAGQVSWVGHKSMEVVLEARSLGADGSAMRVAEAHFVMVFLDPSTARPTALAPVLASTPSEQLLWHRARANQQRRLARKKMALEDIVPHAPDLKLAMSAYRERSGRPMSSTVLHNTLLMHQQDRNAWGRVFGGHLMREAFELAYATAALHSGQPCEAVALDDIAFLAPVYIGSIIEFSSQVSYVWKDIVRVHVKAQRRDVPLEAQDVALTNDFSIAFMCNGSHPAKVYPETIEEVLYFIQGHHQEQLGYTRCGSADV